MYAIRSYYAETLINARLITAMAGPLEELGWSMINREDRLLEACLLT